MSDHKISYYYTCNGSTAKCERKRFGQCGYCDAKEQERIDNELDQQFREEKHDSERYAPRCPSCDVAFRDHLGLTGTCKKLTAATERIAALEKELANTKSHYLCDKCGGLTTCKSDAHDVKCRNCETTLTNIATTEAQFMRAIKAENKLSAVEKERDGLREKCSSIIEYWDANYPGNVQQEKLDSLVHFLRVALGAKT